MSQTEEFNRAAKAMRLAQAFQKLHKQSKTLNKKSLVMSHIDMLGDEFWTTLAKSCGYDSVSHATVEATKGILSVLYPAPA